LAWALPIAAVTPPANLKLAKRRTALLDLVRRVTGFTFVPETTELDPIGGEPDEADADDELKAA